MFCTHSRSAPSNRLDDRVQQGLELYHLTLDPYCVGPESMVALVGGDGSPFSPIFYIHLYLQKPTFSFTFDFFFIFLYLHHIPLHPTIHIGTYVYSTHIHPSPTNLTQLNTLLSLQSNITLHPPSSSDCAAVPQRPTTTRNAGRRKNSPPSPSPFLPHTHRVAGRRN